MSNKAFLTSLLFLCTSLIGSVPRAQEKLQEKPAEQHCGGPVYLQTEVTRKARIIRKAEPSYTEEARQKNVRGRVVLTAVMCRTGEVTDIEVVESLPYGMTQKCVDTLRQMKFEVAEKDGEKVSVRVRSEYNFNMY